jgi:hypothetical protein
MIFFTLPPPKNLFLSERGKNMGALRLNICMEQKHEHDFDRRVPQRNGRLRQAESFS